MIIVAGRILEVVAIWVAVSFVALAATSVAILYLSAYPERSRRLRRILGRLQGFRPLGTEGILFQRTAGCGVACYRMLLQDLGVTNVPEAAEFEVTPAGVSMAALVQGLVHRGLPAKGVLFEPLGQLRHLQRQPGTRLLLLLDEAMTHGWLAPIIGAAWTAARALSRGGLDPKHWVYLEDITEHGVVVRDPLYGRIEMTRRRFKKLWTGLAIVVTPAAAMNERTQDDCRQAG